jgi:glucose-6-phosphate isomerase
MIFDYDTKESLWNCLQGYKIADPQLFLSAPNYFSKSPIAPVEAAGLKANFSRHRIDQKAWDALTALLQLSGFDSMRERYFSGDVINFTEKRAVLHAALRRPGDQPLYVGKHNVMQDVNQLHRDMKRITKDLEQGKCRGRDGEPITDIIHIGIGGSDLGPVMAHSALSSFANPHLKVHFLANVDRDSTQRCLAGIDPGRALVIVVSKSFTTFETLSNARLVRQWMQDADLSEAYCSQHFYAVTSQVERAISFGIESCHILPMWDAVGGRFSLWSGVSLVLAMVLGMDNFQQLLAGAYAMDEHFKSAQLQYNMPVILAMLGIWYGNFLQSPTQAILPYTDNLKYLPNFLQQLHMESLGKSVTKQGETISHSSGRIIWGGVGTHSQHSFHQLLMQGTHLVPADFILPVFSEKGQRNNELIAHCFAQSEALWNGTGALKANGLSDDLLVKHQTIKGGRPSTILLCDQLTPFSLGALVALYEHKVFVQSLVWDVNAFDQWGVEKGKKIADRLLLQLDSGARSVDNDRVTDELLNMLDQEV